MDRRLVALGIAVVIQVGCSEIDTGSVGEKFQEGVEGQGTVVPLEGDHSAQPLE